MEKTEIILNHDGSFVERLINERPLNVGQGVLDTLTENVCRQVRNVFSIPIATDRTGDPRVASIGCTGEIQERNRQLVSANFMAAALAEHLYVLWCMKAPRMDSETVALLPHKFNANLSKLETHRGGHHE